MGHSKAQKPIGDYLIFTGMLGVIVITALADAEYLAGYGNADSKLLD